MTSSVWRIDTDAAERRVRSWLGLGTNLGDRGAHLAAAIAALRSLVDVDLLSGVWESQPFGFADQPVFWNMVVGADTDMTAPDLLAAIKSLEPALGRVASFHMGPRAIDIDLLLHGSETIASERLTVPHPGLLQRAFVLQPLAELAADLRHPVTGETIAVHAARVGSAGVQRLGDAADILPQQGRQ